MEFGNLNPFNWFKTSPDNQYVQYAQNHSEQDLSILTLGDQKKLGQQLYAQDKNSLFARELGYASPVGGNDMFSRMMQAPARPAGTMNNPNGMMNMMMQMMQMQMMCKMAGVDMDIMGMFGGKSTSSNSSNGAEKAPEWKNVRGAKTSTSEGFYNEQVKGNEKKYIGRHDGIATETIVNTDNGVASTTQTRGDLSVTYSEQGAEFDRATGEATVGSKTTLPDTIEHDGVKYELQDDDTYKAKDGTVGTFDKSRFEFTIDGADDTDNTTDTTDTSDAEKTDEPVKLTGLEAQDIDAETIEKLRKLEPGKHKVAGAQTVAVDKDGTITIIKNNAGDRTTIQIKQDGDNNIIETYDKGARTDTDTGVATLEHGSELLSKTVLSADGSKKVETYNNNGIDGVTDSQSFNEDGKITSHTRTANGVTYTQAIDEDLEGYGTWTRAGDADTVYVEKDGVLIPEKYEYYVDSLEDGELTTALTKKDEAYKPDGYEHKWTEGSFNGLQISVQNGQTTITYPAGKFGELGGKTVTYEGTQMVTTYTRDDGKKYMNYPQKPEFVQALIDQGVATVKK